MTLDEAPFGELLSDYIVECLPLAEQVRRSAAFKTAVCLRDPHDRGERAQLNLGHTFAHALETAAGFELPHGRAVAHSAGGQCGHWCPDDATTGEGAGTTGRAACIAIPGWLAIPGPCSAQ